jgi:hypothetical protein
LLSVVAGVIASESILGWMIAGLPDCRAASDACVKLLLLADPLRQRSISLSSRRHGPKRTRSV